MAVLYFKYCLCATLLTRTEDQHKRFQSFITGLNGQTLVIHIGISWQGHYLMNQNKIFLNGNLFIDCR